MQDLHCMAWIWSSLILTVSGREPGIFETIFGNFMQPELHNEAQGFKPVQYFPKGEKVQA